VEAVTEDVELAAKSARLCHPDYRASCDRGDSGAWMWRSEWMTVRYSSIGNSL
jgi:hypothetical protein